MIDDLSDWGIRKSAPHCDRRHPRADAASTGVERCERYRQMPGREKVHAVRIAGPHVVRAAPHLVLPIDDRAIGASSPARTDMVIAEPNGSQPNSSSRIHCSLTMRPWSRATAARRRARHRRRHCGRSNRTPCAWMTRTSSTAQPGDLGDIVAQRIGALRVRPHRQHVVDQSSHGTGRPDRGMRKIGLRVGRRRASSPQRPRAALLVHRLRVDVRAASLQVAHARALDRADRAARASARTSPARRERRSACSSRSATTPRKRPSRTTAMTPGIAAIASLIDRNERA